MNNKKYKHLFELDMLKAYYKLDHIEQIRLQDNYVVPRFKNCSFLNYMKENNIALKSVAIKKCIEEATNKEDLRMILVDIDKKINRLLHRENIDKKLLEQLFCNMGFPINEKIKDDTCLKEFYKINEEYSGRFGL